MTHDDIARLLAPVLMRRLTPAERRKLADALDQLATTQRQLADAEHAEQAKPAAKRLAPRKAKAGPGRAPSTFVRIAIEPWGSEGRTRLRLYIGRGLWYEIGSPRRIDVQRIAGVIHIRAASGDEGYALTAGKGMPRAFVDGLADVLSGMEGKFSAEIKGGAIIVGRSE